MPYSRITELPPDVKNALPKSAQRTFMNTFNNALNKYKQEDVAFRVAWDVVKQSYKKVKDKWIKRT